MGSGGKKFPAYFMVLGAGSRSQSEKKNFTHRLINDDAPRGREPFEGSIRLYLANRSAEFVSLKRVLLFQANSPDGRSANPA